MTEVLTRVSKHTYDINVGAPATFRARVREALRILRGDGNTVTYTFDVGRIRKLRDQMTQDLRKH